MNLKAITQNKVLIYMVGGLAALIIVSSAVLFSNGNLFKGTIDGQVVALWTDSKCSANPSSPKFGDTVTWTANVDEYQHDGAYLFDWTLTPYDSDNKPSAAIHLTSGEDEKNTSSIIQIFPLNIVRIDAAINITDKSQNIVSPSPTTCSVQFQVPTISCAGKVTHQGIAGDSANVTWTATTTGIDSPVVHWSDQDLNKKDGLGGQGNSVDTKYVIPDAAKLVYAHAVLYKNNDSTGKFADCSVNIEPQKLAAGQKLTPGGNLGGGAATKI